MSSRLQTFFSMPFKSRLSKRMFAVFLVCAMLPILLITLISDLYVQQYLESRISQEMRSTSRVYETVVYDTLLTFESELRRFWATHPATKPLTELELKEARDNPIGTYFTAIGHHQDDMTVSAGRKIQIAKLTDRETQFLDRGQTLIRVVKGDAMASSLLMLMRQDGVLYFGAPNMDVLQQRVTDYSAWGNLDLTVLSEDEALIASSLPREQLPNLKHLDRKQQSAIFDVTYKRNGHEHIGVLTTLFLKGHFGGSNWSLMLIKPRDAAFEPMVTFRRTMLLMMLIAIVTICLFMVVLIRRYTSHIGVLLQATQKIKNRYFDHEINIDSGDEFEQLGEAFNTMTRSLRDYRADLKRQARELQERVIEIREARQKERMLQDQLSRAERLESLGQLAGGVAHDFNNLLMAIMGNADLALDELPEASSARANIKGIESASRRAADLCRQMLVYAGRGSYDFELINLSEVIRDVGDLMRVSISKDVTLKYDVHDDLPMISGDASQILQIVLNFITNGSAAIGRQPGEIVVRTGARICTEEELQQTYLENELGGGEYVYLQVSDTGCGMDSKTIARIFDPFFTTKAEGRGLGLAAVLGIIRAHRGALTVASEPGNGSTFTVFFPARAAAKNAPAAHPELNKWKGSGTVLVVDDEEVVRQVAASMLQRLGLHTIPATGGTDAIETFREQADTIQVALLDMRMPVMDGAETLTALRKIKPEIPAILSSGNAKSKFTGAVTFDERTVFVQKPYTLTALAAVIKRFLESSETDNRSAP